MDWLDTIEAARAWSKAARRAGKTVGLIPTMGALHEGHLSLVRRARAENDLAIASIFVNPLQFGPNEDFARYPRDPEGDRALLESVGCDAVFTTTPEAMYPPGFGTYVVQDALAAKLEGAARPGHFRGVLTVVLKLFEIVRPDRAYFGHKDFQQTVVIRRMAKDLDLDIAIVVCPTVREPDGLALSSRNRYLSAAERADALSLSRGLEKSLRLFAAGERGAAPLRRAIEEEVERAPLARLEYAAVVDPETLDPVDPVRRGDVALVAARLGSTRLIDNARFE
jgi:pantoate--beta-alanine ligase